MIFFLILLFATFNGHIRTFVEDADRVFLLKHRHLIVQFKSWGYIYTLLVNALFFAAYVAAVAPLLAGNFGWGWFEHLVFFCYLIGVKMFVAYLRSLKTGKLLDRWASIVYECIIFIAVLIFMAAGYWGLYITFASLYAIGIILFIISLLLSLPRMKNGKITEDEIAIEKGEYTKLIKLIYNMSPDLEKVKVIKRKKPFLFRNSKPIFKNRTAVNGFLELFIKIMIRNSYYIRGYLQIHSITAIALFLLPPVWMKITVFIIYLFVIKSWMTSMWWKVTLAHPQFRKYKDYEGYSEAQVRMIRIFTIPSNIIVAIILIFIIV